MIEPAQRARHRESLLGDWLDFFNGKSVKPGGQGNSPVFGSNGLIGQTDTALFENGLIIGRVGAYCGSVAYCSGRFTASDNTIVARPKEGGTDVRYFYYLLTDLRLNRYAGGSAQPLLTQSRLNALRVVVPSVPTRRKIAALLHVYDGLIENNAQRIKILEEMARRIYEEWFVRLRFPGYEAATMLKSKHGVMPEGWKIERLGDVCELVMGQSPESKHYNEYGTGLPFHQGVTDFGEWFPEDRVYCTVENRIAERGDILFSVRAPVGRINVANKKIVIGRGLCAIRSRQASQTFVFQQLKWKFKEEDMIGGGTIFKAVTKQEVQAIELLHAPKTLVEQYDEVAVPAFREIEILVMKNSNLRRTRDFLLPKLISGELDVSDLDIPTEAIA